MRTLVARMSSRSSFIVDSDHELEVEIPQLQLVYLVLNSNGSKKSPFFDLFELLNVNTAKYRTENNILGAAGMWRVGWTCRGVLTSL